MPVVLIAWYLRARDPGYSSAFMDESIYVVYGRMVLSHQFESPLDQPLHFSFGWYLWPAMAAAADRIAGLVGVRELSALLGTVTVLSVYGFARRLFSPAVGLASAVVFAFLGPAVFASRIATRDTAAICFVALGLWLYVRAWQEKDKRLAWLAAAACFFAAFLCKYLVALYFPLLVLVALRKGLKPLFLFTLPLALACGVYGVIHASDLAYLLQYGRSYVSLKAGDDQVWLIYVRQRIDFWVLLGLSLLAWPRRNEERRWTASLLWLGTAVMLAFQWISRADYDHWKHITYSLIFLTPLAMGGLLRLTRPLAGKIYPATAVLVVTLLAVSLGWAGDTWRMDRFLFWPNVEPIVAFFEGRLTHQDRVLVDDSVLRYYFQPPLRQWQIVDPFYFKYHDWTGEMAYTAAVQDTVFDYIVLDGGIGAEAQRMQAAIRPELAERYALRLSMRDPVLGHPIEIYERANRPVPTPTLSGPRVEIRVPASGAVAVTSGKGTVLEGLADGFGPGWHVRVEVFTNRWYPQDGKIFPNPADGAFSARIYLGGEGVARCYHIVRARLYDDRGRPVAVATNFGIAGANPDGSPPSCP